MTAMATDNASGNAISVGQPGRVLKRQDFLQGISHNAEHAVQISNCSRNMKPQWSPLLLINSLQRSGTASLRSWQPSLAPRCAHDLLAPIMKQS